MLQRWLNKNTGPHRVHIAPAGIDVDTGPKETILQAALNQGLAFPHNCRAGGCGSCKCRLRSGTVKELTDKSYVLSAEQLREHYILACQSVPQSDIEIEVALLEDHEAVAPETHRAQIQQLTPLTHDILHVLLRLETPVRFVPGQYAQLQALEGSAAGIARSYSFANVPESDGTAAIAEFMIRHVPGGRFTDWLFTAAGKGARLELSAPYGQFFLRESAAAIVCIAGGSGLAPIISLLYGALETLILPRSVVFFFGARSAADLYYLDRIELLRRAWPADFQFIPVLSHEAVDSAWPGRRGLIGEHLHEALGEQLPETDAYLCGPPAMIDSCIAVLSAGGVPDSRIHYDKFLDQSHLTVPGATT